MINDLQNKLKYWLKPKENLFVDFQKYVLDRENPNQRRMFIDRKSAVLFVAHIDTVQNPEFIKKTKDKIYASGLDDRLGCLLAYELSNKLDADLLICDLEESIKSTGQYHKLKDYNWIVEFDRGGNDIVTYDLDCKDFRQALSEYWKIGVGAFSDICQLNTQACCMNLGIGYENAHAKNSFVNLKSMKKQIAKFRRFYNQYKDVKFEQDYSQYDYSFGSSCDVCGMSIDVEDVFGYSLCRECFLEMFNPYNESTWPNVLLNQYEFDN